MDYGRTAFLTIRFGFMAMDLFYASYDAGLMLSVIKLYIYYRGHGRAKAFISPSIFV